MKALDDFVNARRFQSFAYFERDCAHLAAEWVKEKTGADPLAPLRVEGGALAPKRLLTALRYIRKCGGFRQAGESLLGPSVPGLTARRGDVVLVKSGGPIGRVSGYSFGVCIGGQAVAPGNEKLEFLPITAVECAWRI